MFVAYYDHKLSPPRHLFQLMIRDRLLPVIMPCQGILWRSYSVRFCFVLFIGDFSVDATELSAYQQRPSFLQGGQMQERVSGCCHCLVDATQPGLLREVRQAVIVEYI